MRVWTYAMLPWLAAVSAASYAVAESAVPVGFTAALEQGVRRSVVLPGDVESRTSSVVAAETQGLVIELNVAPGDRVRQGAPLAHLRPVFYEIRLRAAEGRLKEARARLALAESKLGRARELLADEVISQENLDDAYSEFTAWQGRDEQSAAEIAELKLALDRCVIRAPFDGVVTRKLTDVGQWIDQGGPAAEMVALDRLEVRVEVPERYYGLIEPGGAARVTFEALPGTEVSGVVSAVIPLADPRARTFPVKIRIANDGRTIGVGMLAQVALPIGETTSAVLVPKDAVIRQVGGEAVLRIRNDDTVEVVPVTSGDGAGAWVVIDGEIRPGERVVTRGNERLRPGQAVRGDPQEYPLP